ncbi:MBL fold metallo-hydrolase [Williamsia sp. CHRR-6]|uniref:MBL fold metallo-hydrolase n=1 Tax=Williamsia sp. CHRR-6 TaxID=2835871 RepID=UPI001BDB1E8E|nr:MBL fold metallo-hydrolase [Williamsia sp. CHRR-6]MBT0568166.1 MBL fold metallo-hydrolase [Williamsia sp. CHRR-6]
MRLTKHTHATVTLSKGDATLLIDPGAFTSDAAELIAAAEAILITHEHFDHIDVDAVRAGLQARPELHIHGPESALGALTQFGDRVHAVAAGDRFTTAGFDVRVFGEQHAMIHPEIPCVHNIGYLIDSAVLHPGDAYLVIDEPVDTLLVPTSGPWTTMGDAIEYVRSVKPRQSIQIHDVMLSEVGIRSAGMFLGQDSLTQTTLLTLEPGESVTI